MKYFTAKLYREGNNENSPIYDEFDNIWEDNIAKYRKDLRVIESQMPPQVKQLAREICLHNGKIVQLTKSSINVWRDSILYVIEFELDSSSQQPKHGPILNGHPFDAPGHFWLYEEFQLVSPGCFLLEILTSNGKVLRFRFTDVRISKVTLSTQSIATKARSKTGQTKVSLEKFLQLVSAKPIEYSKHKSVRKRKSTADSR